MGTRPPSTPLDDLPEEPVLPEVLLFVVPEPLPLDPSPPELPVEEQAEIPLAEPDTVPLPLPEPEFEEPPASVAPDGGCTGCPPPQAHRAPITAEA
jgi:hypothetical protein